MGQNKGIKDIRYICRYCNGTGYVFGIAKCQYCNSED